MQRSTLRRMIALGAMTAAVVLGLTVDGTFDGQRANPAPETGGTLSQGTGTVLAATSREPASAVEGEQGQAEEADIGGGAGIEAVYRAQGYAPGKRAVLEVWSRTSHLSIQQFQMGAEKIRAHGKDVLRGVPVSQAIGVSPSRGRLTVRIGDWESGVYFSRLTSRGHVGYAPFVVRPRRLGEHRVAVVVPTNTWAAYNFRDVDGNGVGDTWYADSSIGVVDLQRPFLNRGVPPHFGGYDLGFLRWFAQTGKKADFFSDSDLERIGSGDRAREGVRPDRLPRARGVRDASCLRPDRALPRPGRQPRVPLGQQLLLPRRAPRPHDATEPAAGVTSAGRRRALTGAQYVGWNHNRYPNKPYVVVGARRAPLAVPRYRARERLALRQVRHRDRREVVELAEGHARPRADPERFRAQVESAEMTYYTTAAGSQGLRRRRDELRRHRRVAGRLEAHGEPVGAPGAAVMRRGFQGTCNGSRCPDDAVPHPVCGLRRRPFGAVAFTSNRAYVPNVYIVNADGKDQRLLARDASYP